MLQFCLLAAALLQAPANEPKPATVEGSVVHAASNVPIKKAKVTLHSVSGSQTFSAETGDDGKFTVKDVAGGRYRLTAEKSGYETSAYGSKRIGDQVGQLLNVAAGASLTGLSVKLPKQGAIAGKVLDSSGEPVNSALVLALANRYYQSGRKARIPRGALPVMSNDLGEYRVGQLPPGRYIICAIPKAWLQPNPAADKESKPEATEADVTACFPSAAQMGEATELEIRDGTELPSTDIRLVKTKTVSVQGRLTNVPAGAGTIALLTLNNRMMGPLGSSINPRAIVQGAEGRFEFRNVPPGTYTLHTLPTGLGNAPFVLKVDLTVGDRPLQNLEIPVSIPFEIKGKVNADPGPELNLPSIRVVLSGADDIVQSLAMANATAEGDLTLANLVPGKYRVQFAGIPGTHYVRELRSGDQVSQTDEVEISSPGTFLTVTLATSTAQVTGTVKNDKGEPVPGAMVALIPNPQRAFRFRLSRTDGNGTFRQQNMPPGDYRIVAFDSIDAAGLESEEFLKPFASKLKAIKVDEGGSQSFDLTVVPGVRD